MWPVAYFTAVLARVGAGWKARDVEVDDALTLDDLADALRSVSVDDQPVLAVVEHEDEWFAVVRVDGEDEPRLFVSNLYAASRSHYGSLLAPAADVDDDADDLDDADDNDPDAPAAEAPGDDDDEDGQEQDQDVEEPIAVWAGESDLLEDLGVPGRALRRLVEDHADDPGMVLGEVGDTVGFAELLEALR